MKRKGFLKGLGVAASVLALTATAACGSDDNGGSDDNADGGGTITLGIIPSWTDGLSVGYLWKNVLEEEGYDVEIEEVADAGLLYQGLADGSIDVYPSAWPEVTHAAYMEQHGDALEDLGAYYEGAVLTMAVPEYTDIDSIADLKDNADRFGGEIVGIEAGAGLTDATKNNVMPAYELEDDYTLVESSTTAMLAALSDAIDNEEDIVVTLWRPFWANSEFPVKDLEDPEGAFGDPETLNAIANADFSGEFPDVAEMMGNFKLSDDEYGGLEDIVVNEYGEGNEEEAIEAWLEDNPDFIDSLKG
ncbi:glycine/betaine ABC transporter substrate-binding protein [Aeromicrobium sp. PE09-221]|uniref:glycine betaine ABC transporter substrate-binding protein n=1 Tax=Aeromicrobium sp. PE09-221 TaxID=1898043 RepID=UPI000B3E8E87|nr:glycine betaine ABC transporter substrate-binding protein [Aeromicrobium sp. PE09-221]OUZ12716.1 glycine/betaine ABC transporter substrate-binding protein [Aeromicrobium sp. PE09-221]